MRENVVMLLPATKAGKAAHKECMQDRGSFSAFGAPAQSKLQNARACREHLHLGGFLGMAVEAFGLDGLQALCLLFMGK